MYRLFTHHTGVLCQSLSLRAGELIGSEVASACIDGPPPGLGNEEALSGGQ